MEKSNNISSHKPFYWIRLALPMLLMLHPYVFIFYVLLPENFINATFRIFFIFYVIFTFLIYGMNIWNAFTYQEDKASYKLAYYDMVIKLVHIPFYIGVFLIGVVSMLAMVVPALIFISPIIMLCLSGIDFFLMMTSSMYGINAVLKASKEGILSKRLFNLHTILHCIFIADMISAIILFTKFKKYYKQI